MQTVHLSRLQAGNNPRGHFDDEEMAELVASVRLRGVLQPILVRPVAGEDKYQIIAGERRFRAACEAFDNDFEMPVVIKDVGDEEAEALAVTENTARAAMSVAEEAVAAQRIVLRNKGDKDEAARALAWTRDKLDRRLALMHCVPEVREALTRRQIQVGHAELLATLAPDRQVKVLDGVLKHAVAVHELKSQLGAYAHRLADAIFDTAQCDDCHHNSGRQKVLFGEHLDGDGFCTNGEHYEALTTAELERRAAALRDEVPQVRIVRPEDGFVRIRIVAEGDGAVGAEQAKACRSCANFGSAVSALPGSVGEVFADSCFDSTCNTVKRGAYIKSMAKPASVPSSAAKSAQKPIAGNSRPETAAAAASATPRAVVEYRIEQWRRMLAVVLAGNASLALRFMVSCALTGSGRWIDAGKLAKAVEKRIGSRPTTYPLAGVLGHVGSLSDTQLEAVVPLVPASTAFGMESDRLPEALEWAGVNEAEHFVLGEDFLKLLTKSEIEAVADEVGVKAHLGEAAFKKLAAGKKGELIAGILGAEGFDLAGRVPGVLRYPRKTA